MTKFYGVSTGETGAYGVGDIVVGESWSYDAMFNGGMIVNSEPCYNVFTIKDGEVEYVDLKGIL